MPARKVGSTKPAAEPIAEPDDSELGTARRSESDTLANSILSRQQARQKPSREFHPDRRTPELRRCEAQGNASVRSLPKENSTQLDRGRSRLDLTVGSQSRFAANNPMNSSPNDVEHENLPALSVSQRPFGGRQAEPVIDFKSARTSA